MEKINKIKKLFNNIIIYNSSYGLKPTSLENQQDTYKFKVFVGGLSGPDC